MAIILLLINFLHLPSREEKRPTAKQDAPPFLFNLLDTFSRETNSFPGHKISSLPTSGLCSPQGLLALFFPLFWEGSQRIYAPSQPWLHLSFTTKLTFQLLATYFPSIPISSLSLPVSLYSKLPGSWGWFTQSFVYGTHMLFLFYFFFSSPLLSHLLLTLCPPPLSCLSLPPTWSAEMEPGAPYRLDNQMLLCELYPRHCFSTDKMQM